MAPRLTLAVGSKSLLRNRAFSPEIRDQANACFITLRESLHASGLVLATEDVHPPNESAIVIDLNVQNWKPSSRPGPIRYLITGEPPVIYPENWLPTRHSQYHKVFTWDDSLVDDRRYFLLRYAHNLGMAPGLPDFRDRQFAAMIIGFKSSSRAQQLYSSRFDTIRWFLRKHPTELHLYGAGWPRRFRPPASPRAERFLFRAMNILLGPFYPENVCYLGAVADKVRTFRNYRFAFCYENTHSAQGYITEKIFDAFRAGCVPVYLGPPNATDHIPPDCFIDRRQFTSHEELYAYLKSINAREFLDFRQRIRSYLESPLARQFTPAHFADVLRAHALSDLGWGGS